MIYTLSPIPGFVIKTDTNQTIPLVDGNLDYGQYLEWLSVGNTPGPATVTGTANPNAAILDKITTIERDRQPRALREFFLKNDKTSLADIDAEIETLRAQLIADV